MGITVTVSGASVEDLPLSEGLMREVGLLARERIIRRTLSGLDDHESAFVPYSPGYERAKARELGSASPVNLQLSGGLLNGITITDATRTTVSLGFTF